jgi:hypothetical protein
MYMANTDCMARPLCWAAPAEADPLSQLTFYPREKLTQPPSWGCVWAPTNLTDKGVRANADFSPRCSSCSVSPSSSSSAGGGTLGRHPHDDRPVLIREKDFDELGEITRELLNLLAEMQQMGYIIIATDADKQDWTRIEIPRFRVVGE